MTKIPLFRTAVRAEQIPLQEVDPALHVPSMTFALIFLIAGLLVLLSLV